MNALQLTEYLTNNTDEVLTILDSLGYSQIIHNTTKNELRFAREEGTNPSSTRLRLDTLGFTCFSTSEKGNLYTIVMNRRNCSFPDALNYVAEELGLEKSRFNKKIRLPFGGYYKDLVREILEPECSMETYNDDILKPYLHKYNKMFFDDGIDYQTQEKLNIGFDLESNRIAVPEYTLDGKLCGIMGRSIWSDEPHESRWLPIIPCSRSLTIYGYHQNYQAIQEKGLAIVGESEKFPAQLLSFDCKIGLATCGNSISETQAKYLKGLLIPKIILAYDESLEEEYLKEQAKKLKIDNQIFKNNVGYIFDEDNKYLPKGSKKSPSDQGKEIFSRLMQEKVRWV